MTEPVRRVRWALPDEPVRSLAEYEAGRGLEGLERALRMGSSATIAEIETAGVRGRGGAGFPTGRKWRSLHQAIAESETGFVVVNGAEGEPGTFKDRPLLRDNPFLVLEGALIAARTLGADRIVIGTKARFEAELAAVRAAATEMIDAGIAEGVAIDVVEGPDEYLFGEETALLEVIEGEDPLPRNLAPYHYGLFTTSPQLGWSAGEDHSPGGPTVESANPVLVNNVETLAHVALVLRHGADRYRSMGTPESPGPTIVTISGDVRRAVSAEIELGAPLRSVIDELAGGPLEGRKVKAVMSGVSNRLIGAGALDAPVTYEGLAAVGGGLGSAGFVVFDDSRNMVDVAYQALRFLHVESCGQCNPCKIGTGAMATALEDVIFGVRPMADVLDVVQRSVTTVADASRCYLPTQSQLLITSILDNFPLDVEQRRHEPGDPGVALPKIIDIRDGVAELDDSHAYKNPDWSRSETPVWLGNR